MATPRSRILLVDDDAFIARFVDMALEDHAQPLINAATLAKAAQALGEQTFDLIICDQMLPDGFGLDFIGQLRQGLFAGPTPVTVPVILFSAGIASEHRQRAVDLDILRVLHKPVSVSELRDAVQASRGAMPRGLGPGTDATPPGTSGALDDQRCADRHFAGNVALFHAFRATAIDQLSLDLPRGDSSLARGDWGDLRRLAHSLKTVLPMLGDDQGGETAGRLEQLTSDGGPVRELAARAWAGLRDSICRHLSNGRPAIETNNSD